MGKIGNHEISLDDKGRMIIPSKLKDNFNENNLVISFEFENAIVLREKSEFDKWVERLIEKGNFDSKARTLQRLILGNSWNASLDSKGRILIPNTLLNRLDIKSKVVMVGVWNKIEIFSKEYWDSINNSEDKLSIEELGDLLKD